MHRAWRLALAGVALVAATSAGTLVADEVRTPDSDVKFLRNDSAVRLVARDLRLALDRKTVGELGRGRDGCALVAAEPLTARCDLEVAFPDIGLDGTVKLLATGRGEKVTVTLGG